MSRPRDFLQPFREIQPKFSRFYTRILNQAGLTQPQYALLLQLVQSAPKPMSMTAISRKLFITKPAVTSLVDRLEKHKFLKRLDHPKDRRIFLLEIQPKGQRLVKQMQERIFALILRTAKALHPKERAVIQKFYFFLSRSLDKALAHSEENGP